MNHRIIRSVFERLHEIERRLAGSQWTGKVKEVDGEKHLTRVVLGKDDDGNEVLSPWLPTGQVAGALKVKSDPSVGQVVSIRAESGDIEQGVIEPFHWSDENPAPSDDPDEHVLTLGSVRVTITSSSVKAVVGGSSIEVTGAGIITSGPSLKHNNKEIGHEHVHTGVLPGGSLSGPPQ